MKTSVTLEFLSAEVSKYLNPYDFGGLIGVVSPLSLFYMVVILYYVLSY